MEDEAELDAAVVEEVAIPAELPEVTDVDSDDPEEAVEDPTEPAPDEEDRADALPDVDADEPVEPGGTGHRLAFSAQTCRPGQQVHPAWQGQGRSTSEIN